MNIHPAAAAVAAMVAISCSGTPDDRRNPLEGADASARGATLEGRVADVIPAGSYRYVRVDLDGGGEAWIATLAISAAPAGHVRVRRIAERDRFHSRRLDRTFSHLVFGIVETN